MGDKVANETTHHPNSVTVAFLLTKLEHSDRDSEKVPEEITQIYTFSPFL